MPFSAEQIKDITEREKLCLEFLKEHQMTPAATMNAAKMGSDVFGIKVTPFLNDTKYSADAEVKVQDLPVEPAKE